MKDDYYSKEEFFALFEEQDFQAVNFRNKGTHYELSGFWGVSQYDDSDQESVLLGFFHSKYEAFDAKVFDEKTKSLREIVDEITEIDFN